MWRRSPPSSIERRRPGASVAAVLWATALQAPALPAADDAAEGLSERVAEILTDARFQTQLPLEAARSEPWFFLVDPGVAGRVLGYLLVCAVLVGLVLWAVRALGGRLTTWQAPSPGEPRTPAPDVSAPRGPDAARSLAAERRYAEAVHALLLDAIVHVESRPDVGARASRTSRELLGALPPAGRERAALEVLVGRVESSLFAGRPLGSEECEGCFRSHAVLTRAEET